jgi:nucleoside-diphosphate-sugar epimerase
MANLVTGGSGLVGSELARLLVGRGEKVVIFDRSKSKRLADIEARVTFVTGDLGVWSEVANVVRDNQITHIYHMGAMLTHESEANPWGSFHANVVGTYNVIEAARLFGVERMMFTSSIGTFDASLVSELSDTVLQRPRDFYGVGKLYCEGLGRMYRKKFGFDFRGLRYPSVVGPGVSTPGHWDAPMIQSAITGRPFQCMAPRDRGGPMIYFKDAARAAYALLQAPKDRIKMINYNVGGIPRVTPREIEVALKSHVADVVVNYVDAPGPPMRPTELAWNDSWARTEWDWAPEYVNIEQVVSDFVSEIRINPSRHGVMWTPPGLGA